MDLKRVAIGIHRKSFQMADRFFIEAMKRRVEVDTRDLSPYMQTIIRELDSLSHQPLDQKAENALMFSTRIQNYVLFKQKE